MKIVSDTGPIIGLAKIGKLIDRKVCRRNIDSSNGV